MKIVINKIIENALPSQHKQEAKIDETHILLGTLSVDGGNFNFMATASHVWDAFSTWDGWTITSVNEVIVIPGANPEITIKEFKVTDHEFLIRDTLDDVLSEGEHLKEGHTFYLSGGMEVLKLN